MELSKANKARCKAYTPESSQEAEALRMLLSLTREEKREFLRIWREEYAHLYGQKKA